MLEAFIDDHGSFVIYRSASVRPNHLSDQTATMITCSNALFEGAGCPVNSDGVLVDAMSGFALSHLYEPNSVDDPERFPGGETLLAAGTLLSHYEVVPAILPIARFVFLGAERMLLAETDGRHLVCRQAECD